MTTVAKNIAALVDILPEYDQKFAYEFIKKMVIAWDPDFTKLTPQEAEKLKLAENDEFIPANDIDWNNLEKYE